MLTFVTGVLRRRSKMKIVRALFVAAIAGGFFLAVAQAKPEYTQKEKKACTYCHVKMGSKDLNKAGEYYKSHGHSFKGYKEEKKG
jgi:anaerobic selenocysteine-containing dehydrogenase